MNRLILVLSCIAVFAIQQVAFASGSGRTTRTLKSTASGCGSCHGSSATGAVTVLLSGPDSVVVNATARYTLTITGGPAVASGCNIARKSAGTLSAVTNLKVSAGELTHPSPISFSGSSVTYTFDYVAPATAMLDTLYAVGLSSNGSGSGGDQWNWAPSKRVRVVDVAVPIQLATFSAAVIEGSGVRLEWGTVSEVNNYGFFVERRGDAEATFTELPNSFLPGAGTTLEPQQYVWTDQNTASGVYFYRLRQVDLNGDQSYSFEIVVTVSGVLGVGGGAGTPESYALHSNYPNPFNPTTQISYELPFESRVSLKVFDAAGKYIATLAEGIQPAGFISASWNAIGVSSGVYFYRLDAQSLTTSAKSYSRVMKMLLLK